MANCYPDGQADVSTPVLNVQKKALTRAPDVWVFFTNDRTRCNICKTGSTIQYLSFQCDSVVINGINDIEFHQSEVFG